MQEPYDWEKAMETTRRSAAAASKNSEHAVAGMAKLLREIDRHSNKIASLTKTIDQLGATHRQQVARTRTALDCAQGNNRVFPRLLALGLLAVFAGGVALGGYIVS